MWNINRGGFIKRESLFPNSLSIDQKRPFWISWNSGNISAGVGEYPLHEVIAYQDKSHRKMFAVSFSTWADCDGDWEIDQRVGECNINVKINFYIHDLLLRVSTFKGEWPIISKDQENN